MFKKIKKFFRNRTLIKFVLKNPEIIGVLRLIGKALKDGHISPQEIADVIRSLLKVFGVPINITIVGLKVRMEFDWPRRLM